MRTWSSCPYILLALAVSLSPVRGEQGAVVLPLAAARAAPLPLVNADILARQWTAFQHAPFDEAGFNHLTLPFHYEDVDRDGSPAEALAFSFLMSNSLDWGHGCYCARHAYFVFKSDEEIMRQLWQVYDPGLIASAVQEWSATHAVGGTLRRTAGAYAGALMIYDRHGSLVHSTEYDRPRPYFDLLGDMAVDALTFLDREPTEALKSLLRRPRCHNWQSLIDLGDAAFAPARTEQEFGLYKRILDRDPGFADVRYWWLNQRVWRDRNWDTYYRELSQVLDAYLVLSALQEAYEKAPADRRDQWLNEAERLVGPNHPLVLSCRLWAAKEAKQIDDQLLRAALATAQQFPNKQLMLHTLAECYSAVEAQTLDNNLATSLVLAAIRNEYLPAVGGNRWLYRRAAYYLTMLGHSPTAAALMIPITREETRDGPAEQAAHCASRTARALAMAGHHAMAVPYFRDAFRAYGLDSAEAAPMLVQGAIAAANAGRKDIVAQILRDRSEILQKVDMLDAVGAYHGLLEGKTDHAFFQREWADLNAPGWAYCEQAILLHQGALLRGDLSVRYRARHEVAFNPHDRRFWILFDAYDRAEPRPTSASFYFALDWLHGSDPWVREAVTDFCRRSPEATPTTPKEVLEYLKEFPPEYRPATGEGRPGGVIMRMPAFAVAAAVRQLLEAGDFDTAEELALRLDHLGRARIDNRIRTHARHLWHKVQQARREGVSAVGLAQAKLAEDGAGDNEAAAKPEGNGGNDAQDKATDHR